MAKDKEKKKKKNTPAGVDEEKESAGSKIAIFFVTLLIILIWLGIFGVLIKFDVGGFGSTVLYPLLKDVPVVNQILPNKVVEETQEAPYASLEEAVAYILELQEELATTQAENAEYEKEIENLTEQVAELEVYRADEANFETLKEKFYEEVVFSDDAPDIEQYKIYYESIDPENAAVLYQQVVEQHAYDEAIEEYAKTYSSMKPANAAAIFDTMTDDFNLVAKILENMSTQARSDILAAMTAENAARLTEIMEP